MVSSSGNIRSRRAAGLIPVGLASCGLRSCGLLSCGLVMLAVALIGLAPAPSHAAIFTCRAEVNRTSVAQGGTITLTVQAEGDVSWSADFQVPEMAGVKVFGGGTNQSVTYINGQTMTTVAKSFYLQVETDKDFTVGPIAVSSDGQECSTDPIAIEVTPAAGGGSAQIPPADTGNRTQRPAETGSRTSRAGGQAGDDIFITLEADAQEVWLGQQVVLTFKWYHRIQPWNNPQFTEPRTEGFWREDLGQERRYREVVGARAYNVTEKRYVLFPTRSGELTIEPAELSFPDQGLERFFSSRRSRGPRTLRTDPVTIKVKPLPEKGKPEGFSGLVASEVLLEAAVDRDSVPRGEPVDWKVQLVSDGFLQGFDNLEIPEPEHARTHDAGERFATQVQSDRLVSAITVEKVIVPGQEGTLDVPRVELAWFDADAGRYRTARTAARRVQVKPSNLPYLPEEDSGFTRSEVARLAQDLAFIHTVSGPLRVGHWTPFGSGAWWAGLLSPLALLGAWRLYLFRLSSERRDPAARRRRRALGTARQVLAQAREAGEEPAAGLALVARAVTGFVADCTGVPAASIGPSEVADFAASQGAAESGDRLRRILDLTETARFGGFAAPESLEAGAGSEALAAEAGQLLEQLWKKAGPGTAPGRGPKLSLWSAALLSLLLVGTPARAEVDPARLMAEAGQAYTQGDLDQALEQYRQAEQMGVQDPVLYFNLGNTYARQGQLGRAVASYLRAQRLDPRDGDIKRNLSWVRSHIADLELAEQELPLFIAQAVWLARYLTVREWSLVVVALVWILAGLVAWGWYREGFSDLLRRSGLVLAGVLLLTVATFLWRWHGQEIRAQAVVVLPEISVHSGPEESFPVMFKLHDGLTVNLEGRRQGWARISLGGESLGWLPEDSVLPVNPRH